MPDHDTTIPFGYCECGCGNKTTIASYNSSKAGVTKGQPRRFICGHNNYLNIVPRENFPLNPSGKCMCGCGNDTAIITTLRRDRGLWPGDRACFIRGHARAKTPVSDVDYIIDSETECWVWQRGINEKGYGSIFTPDGTRTAHRYYFVLHKGSIPEDLEIDHLCVNRRCVNPAHLEAVTHAENLRRGWERRRALKDAA